MKRPGAANLKKAKELKALRKARGLKGFWVASRMGIASSYLSILENGKKRWTTNMIDLFMEAIDSPPTVRELTSRSLQSK